MKKALTTLALIAGIAGFAGASNVTVEAQFDITGKDLTKNYLTVAGPGASVTKDTVDAATGASKMKGTEVWNSYRATADRKNNFGGGIQSLIKWGVSSKEYAEDNLTISKAANGVITVQYIHRGTAYKMVTDAAGKLNATSGNMIRRTVGYLKSGAQVIFKEFSATGHAKDVNWDKVWDDKVAAGAVMATATAADGKVTEIKVGAITRDLPNADKPYEGDFVLTLNGNIMVIKASLALRK